MADWLTHSLVGWITGKTIQQEIGLVAIGSLIPDIVKLYPVFNWFIAGSTGNFFLALHTPVGAILIACIIALFFSDIKKTLALLGIGIATHFILDLSLISVNGGVLMLFPFSWDEWQLGLIRSDDYMITVYAVIAAVMVYFIYFIVEKRKSRHYQLSHTTSGIIDKNITLRTTKKDMAASVIPARTNPQVYYYDNKIYSQIKSQEPKYIEHRGVQKKPAISLNIDAMTSSEFEKFVMGLFTKFGYKIEKNNRNQEKAIDFILERHSEKTACQVKRSNKPVNIKAIQAVNAARMNYHYQNALVVTNSNFTITATQYAERCNVELWDRTKLQEKIKKIL